MSKFISPFVFVLTFSMLYGQNTTTSYRAPLDIPLVLAANFGELRPNHFHMGVDFKTNGKEGLALRSVEDGFVSRIKISEFGYGKAIYIAHPNGVTSVYAHCADFTGRIDSLVKSLQHKEMTYEIEIFLPESELPVKKGEIIALSGNTGGSTAPHLHFELRDSESGKALNPLAYGFNVADTKPPTIRGGKIYSVTEEGYMIPGKSQTFSTVKNSPNSYSTNGPVVIPAHFCAEPGGIGIAFDVIDHFDGANNVCGLYASELKVDGELKFGQKINGVFFEESRFINTHKDYAAYLEGRKLHKSFKNTLNPLDFYSGDMNGIIHVHPGTSLKIDYEAFDLKKNRSKLSFELKVEEGEASNVAFPEKNKYYLPDENIVEIGKKASFLVEPGTLYEPLLKNLLSPDNLRFGDNSTALEKAIGITIFTDSKRTFNNKNYIEVTTFKGQKKPLPTTLTIEGLKAESKYAGTFQVKTDTIPPSLKTLNFDENSSFSGKKVLTWRVRENQTELEEYDLYIDGKWHLLEYEYKSDQLKFKIPNDLKGKHSFQVICIDSCGNKAIWKSEIELE